MTPEEKILELEGKEQTREHIDKVRNMLMMFCKVLIDRAQNHDQSKLHPPESELFGIMTPKLATCEYNSEEYIKYLGQLKPALDHHYAKNAHHPEHHPKGVNDMTLVDIVEMLVDWKAASLRQYNGNLKKSIEQNRGRFNISDQLTQILMNTAIMFEDVK